MMFALLLAQASASADWTPTPQQVARLERSTVMPKGAFGPIEAYARYYAGIVRNGQRIIVGELVRPRMVAQPANPPVFKIGRQSDFPAIADGGCDIIHVEASQDGTPLSAPECNGEVPPPPPPTR